MGAWQLVYIGAAIPVGTLLDRLPSRWVLLLAATALAASAFGRSLADSTLTLLLAVGLLGVGGPIVSAGAPKIIAQHFQGAQRGLAMGIYMTGPTLGGIVALVLSRSTLLPLFDDDWRRIMTLWAAASLGVGIIWFILASLSPTARRHPRSDPNIASTVEPTGQVLRELLSSSTLRTILLMAVAVFMFNHGLNNWLPQILTLRGIDATTASSLAAAPMAVGIVASLTLPRFATPARRRRMLAGLAITALLSTLLLLRGEELALGTGLILQGIARSTLMTILILFLVELPVVGDRRAGTASGLFFACAEVGGATGPALLGWISDVTGSFLAGVYTLAALAAAVALATTRLPPPQSASAIDANQKST